MGTAMASLPCGRCLPAVLAAMARDARSAGGHNPAAAKHAALSAAPDSAHPCMPTRAAPDPALLCTLRCRPAQNKLPSLLWQNNHIVI